MNTDTPRTDNEAEHACNVALQYECRDIGSMTDPPMVVDAEFARQLERELGLANETIARLSGEVDARDALIDKCRATIARALEEIQRLTPPATEAK
jgi:hypothetical protein